MEMSYLDYLKQTNELLAENKIQEITIQVKTLGKFCKDAAGNWEPVRYEGYTLITPTMPEDQENANTYGVICEAREALVRNLNLQQIVPAPSSAFHMTVARLISAEMFERQLKNSHEEEFFSILHQLVFQSAPSGPLQFVVNGLSIFPNGVIAAMVSPVSEEDYLRLQAFRNYIYGNQELTHLGIERKRGFNGHVSLLYIEEDLTSNARRSLAEGLITINKQFFQKPLPFTIAQAEVRKFNDFQRYYRESDWPVFSV